VKNNYEIHLRDGKDRDVPNFTPRRAGHTLGIEGYHHPASSRDTANCFAGSWGILNAVISFLSHRLPMLKGW